MPVVKYKNRTFVLRWKPEWDVRVLVAAIKYRNSYGFVSWQTARSQNCFKGLPKLSNKDFGARLTYLITEKYDPAGLMRKKQYNIAHPWKKQTEHTEKLKKIIFKNDVPNTLRLKNGYNPKTKWNERQRRILLKLGKKHRKTPDTIDWNEVKNDPEFKCLPIRSLFSIRSYYWNMISPQPNEKKRKYAISYNKRHRKNFFKNKKRSEMIIRSSVNDFLLRKLPIEK